MTAIALDDTRHSPRGRLLLVARSGTPSAVLPRMESSTAALAATSLPLSDAIGHQRMIDISKCTRCSSWCRSTANSRPPSFLLSGVVTANFVVSPLR